MAVEFVSYTGKYPNLCSGTLTLRIDGKEVVFGNNCRWNETTGKYERVEEAYDTFWTSGGCCGFCDDYSDEYVCTAPWEIDVNELPEKYKEYADEIAEVFNANVPFGCCGGCL